MNTTRQTQSIQSDSQNRSDLVKLTPFGSSGRSLIKCKWVLAQLREDPQNPLCHRKELYSTYNPTPERFPGACSQPRIPSQSTGREPERSRSCHTPGNDPWQWLPTQVGRDRAPQVGGNDIPELPDSTIRLRRTPDMDPADPAYERDPASCESKKPKREEP